MNAEQVSHSILTWVTFLPALGAVVLMLMPRSDRVIRSLALITSLLTFVFSLYLPIPFDYSKAGFQPSFEPSPPWIGQAIRYHFSLDGISIWLVLLTTLIVP